MPSIILPDLVVSFINVAMVDANGRCVDGYQFFTSILNQGSAPADNVTAVEISTGHTFIIGRLEAGQQIDLQIPASSPTGTYIVNVDPENVVPETNETNNNLSYLYPTPTPYAGCAPVSAVNETPMPATVPTLPPAPTSSLNGLTYWDVHRSEISTVTKNGHTMAIMQGGYVQFTSEGRYTLFESGGDLFVGEPMDNPGGNITDTPDMWESSPQWWPANPSIIVFNVFSVNEVQANDLAHSILGYPAILDRSNGKYMVLSDAPSFSRPAASPDGRTIAYDVNGWPTLYEIGIGARTFDPSQYGFMGTPLKGIFFTSPSFSPDGRWLTWWVSQDESMAERTFVLVMFDLVGMTNTILHSYPAINETVGWLNNPLWSPSGEWITFQTSGEFTPRGDLWIMNREGGIGQRFGLATDPVWSPDSQHVAYLQWQPQTSNQPSTIAVINVPSWSIQQTDLPTGCIPLAWATRNSP